MMNNTWTHRILQNLFSRIEQRIRRIFTLDLRALAAFRIGLAIVVIIDLTMGALDLRAFFTDAGIMPTNLLLANYPGENMRALHSISWAYWRQVTLFAINYLLAFCLLIWRKSRVMHILVWAFFCSLNARNPIINSWADAVMRVLLFWAMFLPTHVWRSVDRNNKPKPADPTFFSRATVWLVVQVASIYVRNYVVKTDVQRKSDYTATYTALSIDMLRTSLWTRLYQFPDLLRVITRIRVHLEGRGILLFLIPRKQHRRRTSACLAFILIHIGMSLTMKIGYFPRTCALARMALLPQQFWSLFLSKSRSVSTEMFYWSKSYFTSLFLICCLVYITLWNLRTTDFDKRDNYFPTSMNRYGFLFRLDQYRSMFAPYPLEDDGRFVITGKTENQKKVNLLVPSDPIVYTKPTDFDRLYPGEKRRKLFLNYRGKSYWVYRPAYLQRQCRKRNQAHPTDPLISASMEYVVERTKPNYQVTTWEIVMLATEQCR